MLDIDSWHGGSLAALVERLGQVATNTVQQRSGGGGQHLFYRLPQGCTIRKARLPELPGCELLGVDQSVVLAPSIHPGAGLYRWVAWCSPFERELLPLPTAVLDLAQPRISRWPVHTHHLVRPQHRSAYARAMLRGCLAELRGLSEGERNDKLYRVSLRLGRAIASGLPAEQLA